MSQIRRLNINRMTVLPNLICRFNAIPIKIPSTYFMDTNKLILKLIWKGKGRRPRIANKILKYNIGERTLPNFKTYCNSIVIKSIGKRKDKWMY